MRTMLMSFKPDIYKKIYNGTKIFEHRQRFPDEPIKCYMYVSSPVQAITGIIYLGKRHLLSDWKEEFKKDVSAVERICEFEESAKYAMEIVEFQETTSVELAMLRRDLSKFIIPQSYYYLDGTELLDYLKEHISELEVNIKHTFSDITSDMVCRH